MATEHFAYLSEFRRNRASRPGGARPPPPSTTRLPNTLLGGPADILPPSNNSAGNNNVPSSIATTPGSRTLSDIAVAASVSALAESQQLNLQDRARSSRVVTGAVSCAPITIRTEGEHSQNALSGETNDGFDDEQDRLIYDQALDEVEELIRDHRNGFLPPKPRSAYRYRFDVNPADRSTNTEDVMANPSEDNSTYNAVTRMGLRAVTDLGTGDGRPSDCEVASGRGIGLLPATPSASVHSKTQATTQLVTHLASATETAAGCHRWHNVKEETRSDFGQGFVDNGTWAGSVTTNIDTTDSIQTPSAIPEDRPTQRPTGPFNPASRAKYRKATKPIPHTTLPSAYRRNPLSWVDIHKNPPSQSRNPLYTTNSPTAAITANDAAPRKNGMEIRADDIRQATRMRLKDRSPKLPTPTAVSDDPGRPIVSFDSGWFDTDGQFESTSTVLDTIGNSLADGKSPESDGGDVDGPTGAHIPTPVSAPAVAPQIHITMDEPTKVMQTDNPQGSELPPTDATAVEFLPMTSQSNYTAIASMCGGSSKDVQPRSSPRPLPAPISSMSGSRQWKVSSQTRTRGSAQMDSSRNADHNHHTSPHGAFTIRSKDSATCHECRRPIEGRFVALAGTPEQFHPQCFSCVTCGTGLEALEIHPEPDLFRRERLSRIWRRAAGHILEEEPGKTMAEDGDERLRFYCHLDWHELFAPKCKHCQTPILGEHIVALGAHWHQGHFFCAECGDPFENDTTHIEKDGYAWCIKCQTRMTERRAPKCRKCKEAVLGNYVVAMGGEWHDDCFRCSSCNSTFDDGQIFPKTTTDGEIIVLCTHCRATELKH